jgi:hypothetical protein
MMILARRVTGSLIRFYPLATPPRSPVAWEFGPNPFCCLVRQKLSGSGYCALGRSVAEARQTLIEAELLNV